MTFLWVMLGAALIFGVLCLIVARTFLVIVTVVGTSMMPTLQEGDRLLAIRHWPKRWLRRGQIVIGHLNFWQEAEQHRQKETVVVKRIVGMHGDTIVTRLSDLNQPLTIEERAQYNANEGQRTWHIPADHCFLQGDAPQGFDSHYWGPVALCKIKALTLLKLPPKAGIHEHLKHRHGVQINELLSQPAIIPTGTPAPPFTMQTMQGEIVHSKDYIGQWLNLLVVFPDQFSKITLREDPIWVPGVTPAVNAIASTALTIISIGALDTTRLYLGEFEAKWPILIAPRETNPFLNDYTIRQIPAYCLIDPGGNVQASGYVAPLMMNNNQSTPMWNAET